MRFRYLIVLVVVLLEATQLKLRQLYISSESVNDVKTLAI